jgi:Tol biopolymer transport system component
MNIDSLDKIFVTAGYSPAWSPDGMWLVYVGMDGIYCIQPDGSNQEKLVNDIPSWGFSLSCLHWSADSKKIVYIWVMIIVVYVL